MLSALLQELGYAGPAAIDAILTEDEAGAPHIHWIECNARWSGVSMPLTLVNRLVGDWRRAPFVVLQREHVHPPPRGTAGLIELWDDLLFTAGAGERGLVLLGPTGPCRDPGLFFAALGDDIKDAERRAAEGLARLPPQPAS
jgi:hypothetical protein